MIRETKAYDCTCEKCGYAWFSPTIPSRCSGCKSRKWNEGASAPQMIIEKPKNPSVRVARPIIEKPRAREVETPIEREMPKVKTEEWHCPNCGSGGRIVLAGKSRCVGCNRAA